MVVQQALASRNINNVCENKYVKMAYMAGGMQPQIQQALNLLGCNGPNRKYGTNDNKNSGVTNKYGVTTTPAFNNNDEDNDNDNESDNQNETDDNEESVQSSFTPEKESKLKQIMNIARGEKGAKRNFVKNLFGFGKKDKTFKKGHKLPSSSYKLDKDDADAMKTLEKDIEKYH